MNEDVKVTTYTTPPVTVVGKAFLKTPNMDLAEKFPAPYKIDNKVINLNKRYQIKVSLNNTNKEHVDFLDSLALHEQLVASKVDRFFTNIKPKRIKTEDGEWKDDIEIPTLMFTKPADLGNIDVTENGQSLEGDDLLLDSGTTVVVHFDVKEKINNDKNTGSLLLLPKLIEVIHRPERKSKFTKTS